MNSTDQTYAALVFLAAVIKFFTLWRVVVVPGRTTDGRLYYHIYIEER